MIRINLHALFFWLLFVAAAVFGWPVWIALAWLAVDYPWSKFVLIGIVLGAILPQMFAFNAGLRLRRDQARDRADAEYERDKRSFRQ